MFKADGIWNDDANGDFEYVMQGYTLDMGSFRWSFGHVKGRTSDDARR